MVTSNKIYYILLIATAVNFLFPKEINRGATHPQTEWENIGGTDVCIYIIMDVNINNTEPEADTNDVIGCFYEQNCIGWMYYSHGITILVSAGNDSSNQNIPSVGDNVHFKIYDASADTILDLQSFHEIPQWDINSIHTTPNLFACSSGIPLLDDGTCIVDCDIDPNIDGISNILDIIHLTSLIINNEALPQNECGDINQDQNIDILDVLILLNQIL